MSPEETEPGVGLILKEKGKERLGRAPSRGAERWEGSLEKGGTLVEMRPGDVGGASSLKMFPCSQLFS